MNKENKVLIISSIVLIGFIMAVFFYYILGFYLGTSYNTFLFSPEQFFNDFTALLPKLIGFAPYTPPSEWQNYFPLAYLFLTPFAYIKNKLISSILFGSIFVGFFLHWNIKNLKCEALDKSQNLRNIFIMTFLSYPFLYVIDRGNFDMITFVFFAFFVFAFQSKKYKTAAVLLGIINAFKPFSLLFLVLFVFEKKYRELFLCLGISFLLVLGGFMIFKGNIFNQISVMLQSWRFAWQTYVLKLNGGMNNSSSLFMSLKYFFCLSHKLTTPFLLDKICNYIGSIITVFTIFFTWREKVFWKKITLLTLYMLTVPSIVFDYKLIFIFVPVWLFINAKEASKFDLIYTILFGLMLIPKKQLILEFVPTEITLGIFSVIFNPLIMLTFMGLIIFERVIINKKENADG